MTMKKTVISIGLILSLAACAGTGSDNSADVLTMSGDGVVHSERFNLMWQQNRSKLFSSATDAQHYVQNLRLGGYSDWRIPSKSESHNLFFSLDFGSSNAKDLGMKMDGSMWIVTEGGKLQSGAWDAGETCCITRTFLHDSRGRVRAVRP